MKIRKSILLAIASLFTLPLLAGNQLASIILLAADANEGAAVVQMANSEMQALRIGDGIKSTNARLTQVTGDRAIFEDVVVKEDGTKVKEIVWIYLAKDGKSRVERLRRQQEKSLLMMPDSQPLLNIQKK